MSTYLGTYRYCGAIVGNSQETSQEIFILRGMCHGTYIIAADRSSARLDYVLLLVVLRYVAAVMFRNTF